MTIQTVSLNKSYGGTQGVYRHASRETGTDMTFSVYVPPHAGGVRRDIDRKGHVGPGLAAGVSVDALRSAV